MPSRPELKIGIAGFGTVGQGVWKNLASHRAELESRAGARLTIAKVAVRDLNKARAVKIPVDRITTDAMVIARDPQIDILCELMGGTSQALKVTRAALESGKIVITANKALLCDHGRELFALAAEKGTQIYYEASVAGGIPIIKAIREGLVANRFPLIYGILNGTCNYILTRMQLEGKGFDEIVADARRLGYVEADESLDLDGWDTAHKTAILTYLAHGTWISTKQMSVDGIRDVTLEDIQWAEKLGYKIKLLAEIICDSKKGHVFASVLPSLISKSMILSNVDSVFNAVSVTGDVVGESVYIGRGAGMDATASAVLADLIDAAQARLSNFQEIMRPESALQIAPLERVRRPFYIRLTVKDRPGVLSEVASILAQHSISIETVLQMPGPKEGTANLVLTTHSTSELNMGDAVSKLHQQKSVLRKPFILRIADFEQSLS